MNNEYSLRLPLSVTPIRILPVNKILKNLGQIQFIAKSTSMYTKSVRATCTRPFGEVGGMSPLQLLSGTHFPKIEVRKVIAKNKFFLFFFS